MKGAIILNKKAENGFHEYMNNNFSTLFKKKLRFKGVLKIGYLRQSLILFFKKIKIELVFSNN